MTRENNGKTAFIFDIVDEHYEENCAMKLREEDAIKLHEEDCAVKLHEKNCSMKLSIEQCHLLGENNRKLKIQKTSEQPPSLGIRHYASLK